MGTRAPLASYSYVAMVGQAGAAWLLVCAPAAAQPEAAAPAGEPADPAEIVVTAQRRSERLDKVPMSVTVLSPTQIQNAGVQNFMDLTRITPGVQMNYSGSVPGVAIRGVSTVVSGYQIEPNVAIYIDGFYEPQPVTLASDMANLADVQVLKGPQGTLYGRNATGGAMLITTLGPTDHLTGKADVSYARFDTVTANAYIGAPLSDTIRMSLSGHVRHGDLSLRRQDPAALGATQGTAGRFIYENVRGKLEADIGERLTATIGLNYSKVDDSRANYYSTYAYRPAFLPQGPRFGVEGGNVEAVQAGTTKEATLKLALATGIGTLTSYTGFAHRNLRVDDDFDGTYLSLAELFIRYRQDTVQQSVDYAIDAIKRLKLNVGGIYYHDALKEPEADPFGVNFTTVSGGAPINQVLFNAYTSAWALYADGTYDLTDRLSVTVGGRYSYDRKSADFTRLSPAGAAIVPYTANAKSWREFTPRGNIRYEFAPRTSVYASVTRGYRSGAFNAQGPVNGQFNPAAPEKITAYELGFKMARRAFHLSLAAFYYDYTDLQATATVPLATGGLTSVLLNAPGAKAKGVEGEFSYNPMRALTLRGGALWEDAHYTSFTNAVGTGVNPANTANIGNQAQDWSGHQLPRAPRFTANGGFDYVVPLSYGKLLVTSTVSYTDSYVIGNASLYGPLAPPALRDKQRFRQGAYTLLSAQLGWTDPGDHITVTLFGDNLTNASYRLSYNGGIFGDYSTKADPRTYGVRLGYKF